MTAADKEKIIQILAVLPEGEQAIFTRKNGEIMFLPNSHTYRTDMTQPAFFEELRDKIADKIQSGCWNDLYTRVNQKQQADATAELVRKITMEDLFK